MSDYIDQDTLLNVCDAFDQQLTSGNMINEENCWMNDVGGEDTLLLNACEAYEQQQSSELADINDATESGWMNDDVDEDILLNACQAYEQQLTSGNTDNDDADVEHNNRRQENDVDNDDTLPVATGEIQKKILLYTMFIYHWLR